MNHLIIYLLKVILCSAIFFAYYQLVLKNKSFHPYNRFYLLSTAVLSIVLPLLHIRMFDFTSDNERMLALFQMLDSGSGQLPAVHLGSPTHRINWEQIALMASLAVTLVLLTLIIIRIFNVFALKKRFPSQTFEGVHFINTDIEQAPFSFLNNLFWRRDIRLSEQVGQQIYRHEMAHIRQRHSVDKLVMHLIRAVFWMNPVYYYMQRELLLIHEYMADKQAVRDGDTEAFARMLLTSQLGGFGFEPAHPLSYSSIKKRLHMITNSHKPKYSYLRRLLFLPLLFSVTFVFALRAHQKQIADETQQLEKLVLIKQAEQIAPTNGSGAAEQIKMDTTQPKKGFLDLKLGDKHPLIVVDGEEQPADFDLKSLDVNDIENISILKEESATRIYGDKGKEGVIQIFTKGYTNSDRQEALKPITVVGFKAASDNPNSTDTQKVPLKGKVITGWKKAAPAGDTKEVVVVGHGTKSNVKPDGGAAAPVKEIIVVGHKAVDHSKSGTGSQTKEKEVIKVGDKAGDPLYILDGTPTTGAEINAMSPSDIQSITILKDENAKAIYGEKAKDGVILVVTKAKAKTLKANKNSDEPEFKDVQIRPSYPGGQEAWSAYLLRNTQNSVAVDHDAPVGDYKVTVSFLIGKDGEISEITAKTNEPQSYGTTEEAVRVIKAGGKWNPALQNGRPVAFREKQEIVFSVRK